MSVAGPRDREEMKAAVVHGRTSDADANDFQGTNRPDFEFRANEDREIRKVGTVQYGVAEDANQRIELLSQFGWSNENPLKEGDENSAVLRDSLQIIYWDFAGARFAGSNALGDDAGRPSGQGFGVWTYDPPVFWEEDDIMHWRYHFGGSSTRVQWQSHVFYRDVE